VPQQARAVAIMPNDLDQATAAVPKNVEITRGRIPLQTFLSRTRKGSGTCDNRTHSSSFRQIKKKPFNSNVAGHLLTIATFGFSYPRVSSDTPSFAAFTPRRTWCSLQRLSDLFNADFLRC